MYHLLQNVHTQHGHVGPPGEVLGRNVAAAQAVHAEGAMHHAVHEGGRVTPHQSPLAARGRRFLDEGARDGHQQRLQGDVRLCASVLKHRLPCVLKPVRVYSKHAF